MRCRTCSSWRPSVSDSSGTHRSCGRGCSPCCATRCIGVRNAGAGQRPPTSLRRAGLTWPRPPTSRPMPPSSNSTSWRRPCGRPLPGSTIAISWCSSSARDRAWPAPSSPMRSGCRSSRAMCWCTACAIASSAASARSPLPAWADVTAPISPACSPAGTGRSTSSSASAWPATSTPAPHATAPVGRTRCSRCWVPRRPSLRHPSSAIVCCRPRCSRRRDRVVNGSATTGSPSHLVASGAVGGSLLSCCWRSSASAAGRSPS